MDPIQLLLPEIWDLVFDKVEDPQDWHSLYRSSPHFQEVVGEKRTTALLPQVFPHLLDCVGVTLPDILGLRLVSRSWKVSVDETLENGDTSGVMSVRFKLLKHAYNLQASARISSFLERFENHSGIPFVGRGISFKYDYNSQRSAEEIPEYNLLTTRLLDQFGVQLKTLYIGILNTSFDNCAAWLQSCLGLTPNLDSLTVGVSLSNNGNPDGDGGELRPDIGKRSLPVLFNLKSISFVSAGAAERSGMLDLQNTVLRLCNPNSLKSVETVGVPSKLLTFPHVESAVVRLDTAEDYSNLATGPWPLSKLTVSNHFYDDSPHPISQLFECLEQFKDTLTSLRLSRPILLPADPFYSKLKLDLPQLTQLTIQQQHPNMSLGFLTNLAALEVLSIVHNPNSSYCKVQEFWDILLSVFRPRWPGGACGRVFPS